MGESAGPGAGQEWGKPFCPELLGGGRGAHFCLIGLTYHEALSSEPVPLGSLCMVPGVPVHPGSRQALQFGCCQEEKAVIRSLV